LKVGVVVNVRRERIWAAEVMGVGAAEKRVRVVEGRRRKEARSLEAIFVAVLGVVVLWGCFGGGARMGCAEVDWLMFAVGSSEGCVSRWRWSVPSEYLKKGGITKTHSSSVSFTIFATTKLT
jgi:hypothetical protein